MNGLGMKNKRTHIRTLGLNGFIKVKPQENDNK